MIIVSTNELLEPQYPDMKNQILLDSGCSYHLIRDQNELEKFVGNDDKDSLGLGEIHLGNGVTVPISGYGNKFPFGRMLVVPTLLYKMILSAGLLVAHDCKLEFSDTKARLINKQGYLLLTAVRQSNHLYYINKVGKGFKDTFNTETPLPNLLIPIYCSVLSSSLKKHNNNSFTLANSSSTSSSVIPQQIDTGSRTTTSNNVDTRQQSLLKRINNTQFNPMKSFRKPGLTTLPDPLGLMEAFLEVDWPDNLYSNMQIHGYRWYHVPPYLYLHIYHTDEIE